MAITAGVTIDVEIHDPQELWRKARDYLAESGVDHDYESVLGREEQPDIGACLIMLLDRSENLAGAEIINSSADVDDDGEDEEGEDEE